MCLISRLATNLIKIPVKPCTSFDKDGCFQFVRKTLTNTGINWSDILDKRTATVEGVNINIPKMDNIFFHNDRFEVLIDAKGFEPSEIKCKMTPMIVEVFAHKHEKGQNNSRTLTLSRQYQLPQSVTPERGICCLSSEGILLITAPWVNNNINQFPN